MTQIDDFLDGEKMVGGFNFRPFTVGSKIACEQLGLTLFTTGDVSPDKAEAERQIMTFAWLHSQPLPQVLAAIRNSTASAAAEEFAFSVPVADLPVIIAEINRVSAAVADAVVDVHQKPGSGDDKTPGNSTGQGKPQD